MIIESIHPVILISIGLCILLLICVLGKKTLFNFLGRAAIGITLILLLNLFLPQAVSVGINLATILCVGILGIPGVATLYIISFLVL